MDRANKSAKIILLKINKRKSAKDHFLYYVYQSKDKFLTKNLSTYTDFNTDLNLNFDRKLFFSDKVHEMVFNKINKDAKILMTN